MYQILYLPVARQDIINIVKYISHELGNPKAAERLAMDIVESAEILANFPYANKVYVPIRPLKHEYRKLLVKNHIVFYWVDEEIKTVTIARIIYARRDYDKLI